MRDCGPIKLRLPHTSRFIKRNDTTTNHGRRREEKEMTMRSMNDIMNAKRNHLLIAANSLPHFVIRSVRSRRWGIPFDEFCAAAV